MTNMNDTLCIVIHFLLILLCSLTPFKVRDSISLKGNYVLTCLWRNKQIHFQINQTIIDNTLLYHFENEQFNSIINLIEFYQSHSKPITQLSQCIIRNPICNNHIINKNNENINEITMNYANINRSKHNIGKFI